MYRARLLVRISPRLDSDSKRANFHLDNREVTVLSHSEGPLSKTDWITFEALGFPDKTSAQEFGDRLRTAVEVTGIVTSPAADTGTDMTLGTFGKAMEGRMPSVYRIRDERFGLEVYDDDAEFVVFVSAHVNVTTVALIENYLHSMSELSFRSLDAIDGNLRDALRYVNFAKMAEHPLSRIVLAFAAVEFLGQTYSQPWSPAEKSYLKKLIGQCKSDEQFSIAASLDRLYRTGLSQGVRELIDRIALPHLKDEWKGLYQSRSELFHGRELYPFTYTDRRVSKLANGIVRFASKVVLRLIERKEIRIPEIAKVSVWGQPEKT